jgi:hypothetical protein
MTAMRPSWRHWAAALLGAVAGGCQFDRPADVLGPVDAAIDAPEECVPGTITCDDTLSRYVECSPQGTIVREIACALGCSPDVEKCVDIDPSNFLADQLDMARDRTDVPSIEFVGNGTIDTDSGAVTNNGQAVDVPTVNGDNARVFLLKSLVLDQNAFVRVSGHFALVLLVDGDVTIRGTIDVSADADVPGPGSYLACLGRPTDLVDNVSNGGGGGGGWTAGADGGRAGDGQPGAAGGAAALPEDGQPLRRGCDGGLGGELGAGGLSVAGAGGGAIQISSRGRIRLIGGAIDAGGGGARVYQLETGATSISGGGGGAGGTILLEAPEVSLESVFVVLNVYGGGGSAAGLGLGEGSDGLVPSGGRGGVAPGVAGGGRGGTEASPPDPGQNAGSSAADGGGGGGAVGIVRINTASGTAAIQPGLVIHGHYSSAILHSRLVP